MSQPSLRILQILRAPVGGLFRHVYDLTIELAARGHEVGMVADSLHRDALSGERLEALGPSLALGVHSLPIPRVFGPEDISSVFKVRALADRLNVDVLHGHGAKGGFNARLSRWGAKRRVSLYTPHGGVLNYRPGSLVGGAFRIIERAIMPLTDAFIFESAFALDAYMRQIGQPGAPHPVIHNGITEAEFEPIVQRPDACDFVFIGEFRAAKGISFMLEALSRVAAPDGRGATLAMAGGGEDQAKVEAQISALGLTDRVRLLGVRPAREALTHGRIELVPSLAESLPYVIMEGAAAGIPVISTDVGGIREIYGPTAGSLIPAANAEALRIAMQKALDDPAGAATEAMVRLDHVRRSFHIKTMADRIEGLYLDVLKRRRS